MAAVVVAVDQTTKSLAVADLHRPVHLVGPLGLAIGYNSGSAFSLFTGSSAVLGVVAFVIIAVLVVLAWRTRRTSVAVAIGLLLGGAVGNLADRVVRGHHGSVVDFISLTDWPTFNIADACITVSAVLLVVLAWRRPPIEEGGVSRGLPGQSGRDTTTGRTGDHAAARDGS